jgi:hypothetical protein
MAASVDGRVGGSIDFGLDASFDASSADRFSEGQH